MKTIFCYAGDNGLVWDFARTVGYDKEVKITKNWRSVINLVRDSRKNDTLLLEGKDLRLALMKFLRILHGKLIMIVADGTPYKLGVENGFIKPDRPFEKWFVNTSQSRFLKKFRIFLLKYVDGFIVPSKMDRDLILSVFPKANTAIIKTPIYLDIKKLKASQHTRPRLNGHNICIVSSQKHNYLYKGLDILVGAFRDIKRRYNDANLYIMGKNDEEVKRRFSYNGVKFTGFVSDDELIKTFKKCCLYVHPGRGDDFPRSVIEAMYAGLPAIVSEWTGTKEIPDVMVSKLSKENISNMVESYFRLPLREKVRLSNAAMKSAKSFEDKASILKSFKPVYKQLLTRISRT